MDYEVTTLDAPEQAVVSIREQRPQDDLPAFLRGAFAELFGYLRELRVAPAGPPMVLYFGFGPDGVDAEVCVPIATTVAPRGRVGSRSLPAMTVARTLHVGRYEELRAAYAAVSTWAQSRGFEVAGPFQERYLNGPGDGVTPSEYRTEIEVPVARAAVAAGVAG